MLVLFFRTIFLYALVILVTRLMGKRQIGQLQPFEFAVTILISELAAIPMQSSGVPILHGVIPIITILIVQLFISVILLKNQTIRSIICGRPSILIKNGLICKKTMNNELYTISDLLEQLRIKNYSNVSDIEFAILETNGELSVIPKPHKKNITPEDLKINSKYEGLNLELILDGKIQYENLKLSNLDYEWLKKTLAKEGISSPKDILFASLDTSGELFYQKYD